MQLQKTSKMWKILYFEIFLHVVAKMVNIIDDSVITCNENIEETKTV